MIFCFTIPAFAECIPGTSWTAAWTDSFGETTYSLVAPCKVYIGIPFSFTASVADSIHPDGDVGVSWAIKDNGSTVAGGGFNWITLVNGQWQRVLEQTYTGNPIDHLLEFKFTDLGEGAGAHWWGSNLIGAVTLDPFPPSANSPPAVEAGPSILMLSENQSKTVIEGSASDADGDPLSYRWLEGATELQSSSPVGVSGSAALEIAALPALSIGAHTLTLEVSDGTATVTDTMVVSVENSAPVAVASTVGTFNQGDAIRLNGSVADYDGDALSYRWLEGTTLLTSGVVATQPGGTPAPLPEYVIDGGLPLGTHTLTLEVGDLIHSVTAQTTVSVIDTVAPALAPVASTSIIWPPNGAMTEVVITANARDNSGDPVLLSVMVNSNQSQLTDQDGKPMPDCSIVSIDQTAGVIVLQLRSSRSGKGGDGIYTVNLTATDASGNSSSAVVSIKAPHDLRH
jgi:hypothetical protein